MRWSDWIWLSLLAAPVAFEIVGIVKFPKATMTRLIQRIFQVRTSIVGRIIWVAVWLPVAGWMLLHVLDT